MKTIKALIVDDEEGAIEMFSLLLNRYHPDVEICGTAGSAAAGLRLIEEQHTSGIDVVFLDIQMPGGDGFSLLQNLPEIGSRIIFTTAYDEYAIRAIRFSALDYLLKPINNNELTAALQRLRMMDPAGQIRNLSRFKEQLQQRRNFEKLAVSTINDIEMIALDELLYLESDNNYTTLYLNGSRHIVSSRNIGYYHDLLNESSFFRIHKSYLINLKKMKRYIRGGSGNVEMEDGTRLPVSIRRKEEFVRTLALI